MNDKLVSIGKVSKLFHISISTLRHYESIGLLKPEYVDKKSKHRFYSAFQFEALNTIRYLRELNMPLEEIKDFLSNKDVELIEQKLKEQKKVVIEKQENLKRIEAKINNRLKMLDETKKFKLNTIIEEEKDSCNIIWLDKNITINSYLDMEPLIRQFEIDSSEAIVFLGKVGLGISINKLNEGEFNSYDGLFLILDKEDYYNGKKLELNKTKCVTIRFCGSHNDSSKYYQELLNYIKEKKYTISSFAREITMIDYGITNDTSKFITEISIPIK